MRSNADSAYSRLFLRPRQAELAAGDQIGQCSRTRALERLERIREPAMVEQLQNRRVVEIDPVGGKGSAAALVTQRPPIALQCIDGLQVGAERRVVVPLHLRQHAVGEGIARFVDGNNPAELLLLLLLRLHLARSSGGTSCCPEANVSVTSTSPAFFG